MTVIIIAVEQIPDLRDKETPPIQTAEEAAGRAEQFLGRYYAFKTLLSVRRDKDLWRLSYQVDIFAKKQVEVTLDADTGDVVVYGPEQTGVTIEDFPAQL